MADRLIQKRVLFTDGKSTKGVSLDDLPDSAWTWYTPHEDSETSPRTYYEAVPWLWRGVQLRAQSLSQLPFALVRGGEDFDSSATWENKVGFLPNPVRLLWMCEASLCLAGAAYWARNAGAKTGQVKELQYMLASSITPVLTAAGLESFKRRMGSKTIVMPPESVLYVWLPDPYVEIGPGTPPAHAAMQAAGVAYNKDVFVSTFFERGMIRPQLIGVPAGTSPEERNRLKAWLKAKFSGVDKSWSAEVVNADALTPMPLGDGIDSLSNVPLTEEARQDMATALGIPHTMLDANAANYATAQQDSRNFLDNTIVPEAQIIQSVLNEQLFEPMGLRWEFRPEVLDVYQEDEASRAQALQALTGAGMDLVLAMQILGFELPEGYTYEEMMAQEEEKQRRNEEMAERLRQAREQAPPPGNNGSKPPEEEEEQPPAFRSDLDKWRRVALRRFAEGKSLDYPFESEAIPGDLNVSIRAALLLAGSEEEVRAAFQPLPFCGWESYP